MLGQVSSFIAFALDDWGQVNLETEENQCLISGDCALGGFDPNWCCGQIEIGGDSGQRLVGTSTTGLGELSNSLTVNRCLDRRVLGTDINL